jgi:carbon storage regulator
LGESIAIDDHIKIRVVQIKGKQVRLGIEAPKDTKIHREEVYVAIQDQNLQSADVSADKSRSVARLLKP